jgi:hypothetical protein
MTKVSATVGERVGVALGWAAAPVFAVVSWARRARTFHPRGDAYLADVTPLPGGGALGEALAGFALVRFSGALWKSRWEHLDVLGCALRFRRREDASTAPDAGDQDLLLATILRPWTMGLAPFTTDASDYLDNLYYAVSPFDVPGFGRAFLRLRPEVRHSAAGSTRAARLDATVARDGVALTLEVRQRWRWGCRSGGPRVLALPRRARARSARARARAPARSVPRQPARPTAAVAAGGVVARGGARW